MSEPESYDVKEMGRVEVIERITKPDGTIETRVTVIEGTRQRTARAMNWPEAVLKIAVVAGGGWRLTWLLKTILVITVVAVITTAGYLNGEPQFYDLVGQLARKMWGH